MDATFLLSANACRRRGFDRLVLPHCTRGPLVVDVERDSAHAVEPASVHVAADHVVRLIVHVLRDLRPLMLEMALAVNLQPSYLAAAGFSLAVRSTLLAMRPSLVAAAVQVSLRAPFLAPRLEFALHRV